MLAGVGENIFGMLIITPAMLQNALKTRPLFCISVMLYREDIENDGLCTTVLTTFNDLIWFDLIWFADNIVSLLSFTVDFNSRMQILFHRTPCANFPSIFRGTDPSKRQSNPCGEWFGYTLKNGNYNLATTLFGGDCTVLVFLVLKVPISIVMEDKPRVVVLNRP